MKTSNLVYVDNDGIENNWENHKILINSYLVMVMNNDLFCC